jgi:hypothetical protein
MLHRLPGRRPSFAIVAAALVSAVCCAARARAASVGCAANPAGGPHSVDVKVSTNGADLDLGWTGAYHDLRPAPSARVTVCLSGCDAAADTTCDASGTTGEDSLNGTTFGPPWPVIAAGAGMCVVHRFDGSTITGTADYATGAIDLPAVGLTTDVYATTADAACPQCVNGTCDSGPSQGATCKVDATVAVNDGGGTPVPYAVSSACLPGGTPAAHVAETIQLTTGKATPLTGSTCSALPRGACDVAPQDDACGGGACDAACTGAACVAQDGALCLGLLGGVSQKCCSTATATSCLPIHEATLAHTGKVAAPVPHPKPTDATYMSASETLVGTFCVNATGDCTLDAGAGFPGPGSVVLPVKSEWRGYLSPGVTTTTTSSTTTTTRPHRTTTTLAPAATTTTTTSLPRHPHPTTTTTVPPTHDASATVQVPLVNGRHARRIVVTCRLPGAPGTCEAEGFVVGDTGAQARITTTGRRAIGGHGRARVVLRLDREGRRLLKTNGSLAVVTRVKITDHTGHVTALEGHVTLGD